MRVLVFGMTDNPGGVESFLLNYYRHIDKTKIQFDFLCNTQLPIAHEEELVQSGADIYRIVSRRESRRLFYQQLKAVFRENEGKWDAIWVNVCSLANIDYLIYAKKAGIPRRIIHSHNSQNMEGIIRRTLHEINKARIQKYATDYWACSDRALNWFYKKSLRKQAVVIPNAIDVERMRFLPAEGRRIREQYGWNDRYIIGNVGRLHFQKNQQFLLEAFREYHSKKDQSILVLVGQGEDESRLKKRAEELGLECGKDVFFAGVQSDIRAWLSSFDLFVFPSLFEGLSITLLEAQANGLPILASQEIYQEDIAISRNISFLPLAAGAHGWSEKMLQMENLERQDADSVSGLFIEKGYSITHEANKMEMYLLNGQ